MSDILVNNFQAGIADSPHLGIADMRCVNILSSPGEVSVNFKTAAMNQPPTVSALAYTVATTDIFTVSSTAGWYNGMAVQLNTVVTAVGISTGRVYWVGDLTATTFKLYKSPSISGVADVTTAGNGTLSSYTLSAPLDKVITYETTQNYNYEFILDDTGKVWWIYNNDGTVTNNLVYLGNDTLTGTTGRAITFFKDYLIVFRTSTMDALFVGDIENGTDLDAAGGWIYGWESISSVDQARRPVLVGQDNIMYYGNNEKVGSISEVAGSDFDPSSGATYAENTAALDLPAGDDVESLGELGVNLLIGGKRNYVYPWDRTSPSFDLPTPLPENKTVRIVTANNVAYLFAGNRGRIYATNGSSAVTFKKIPDYVSGVYEPYYAWSDAYAWRSQLYFSFTATQNDGTALTSTGGVWAIDLVNDAFRHVLKLSYDTYGGTASVIVPHVLSDTPPGAGLYIGWSHSGTYGVDVTSTAPYQNYETRIDSRLIPVGTFLDRFTPEHFEHKLAKLLVSGEAVRVSYRLHLTDSFSTIYTATTAGLVSGNTDTPFENAEWVQIRIELSSAATTPSYVPLTQLLIT